MLLIDDPISTQSVGYVAGDRVGLTVLLSNWTFGRPGAWGTSGTEIAWTATVDGSTEVDRLLSTTNPFASGTIKIAPEAVPQGHVRAVGTVNFTMPPATATATSRPAASSPSASILRVVVSLELQVVGYSSSTNGLKNDIPSETTRAGALQGVAGTEQAWKVGNSWEFHLFPVVAPIQCDTPVFASESLLSAVRQVCSNAVPLPTSGNFTPPAGGAPFVCVASRLASDVASAIARQGGAVLVISPTTGEFPVCASSAIGPVPTPVGVGFDQPFWLQPGTTGTLVYNTSLTRMLGMAAVNEQVLGCVAARFISLLAFSTLTRDSCYAQHNANSTSLTKLQF